MLDMPLDVFSQWPDISFILYDRFLLNFLVILIVITT